MTSTHAEPHISTLLDQSTSSEAGIITYHDGDRSKPVRMSYRQLRRLALQNAKLLLSQEEICTGKVILILFQDHLENIVWFWAAILAGCVPCLSTRLVNNSTGRIAQLKHLQQLLLDPVVITSRQLWSTDFADNNDILRIVIAEDIEELKPEPENAKRSPDRRHYPADFDLDNRCHAKAKRDSNPRFTGAASNPTVNGHADSGPEGVVPLPQDLAALMLTSGSTGNSKAVCLTHRQIIAAIEGKSSVMPLPQESALLNWIGLDHVASLVEIHLCALFAGLDQVHVPAAEVVADPLLFLRLISEHGVSRTFAPDFFLRKLSATLDTASSPDLQDINLNRLLYIASGGEPNRVDISARVTDHLVSLGAPSKNIVIPGFGMTETCAGAIFNLDCPTIDIESDRQFAALGTCVPGIRMRISPVNNADPNTTEGKGAFGSEGALEIQGPIVFKGYFNNEQATQEAFTPDGWLRTGDLATIDENGHLNLVGRLKEVININGVKYLPQEIEEAIKQEAIPGIALPFVVCFGARAPGSSTEENFVVYQHDYDVNNVEARVETLHGIVRMVMMFTGARPRVLPLAPGWLNQTALGKISRSKVRSSLVEGHYRDQEDINTRMIQLYCATHFSGPRDDTERALMRVFLDTLALDATEIGVDTPIFNVGVSSVDLIRLKRATEKMLGIPHIPIMTLMAHTTIRSLASAVKQLGGNPDCEDEYTPVVTLQSSGSKVPLWLIHPGIGEVLVFLGLVKYFPDRPIHAFRARGFNQGEKPFQDLNEVLTVYLDGLKQKQPHGPYAIAGYSYGSMVGFELAKLLEAKGDVVQFLGSFNLPPHIKQRMRLLDWTAGVLHIAHFCGIISEQRSEELVDELRGLPPKKQVAMLLAESDQQRCAELALTQDSLQTWTDVAWSLQKIGWEYDPSGLASHMDVFYCQPLKIVARTREEYRTTKLNHWVDFMREEVRFHEVDGEHYTMIGPDHVAKFQQTLKEALAARGL